MLKEYPSVSAKPKRREPLVCIFSQCGGELLNAECVYFIGKLFYGVLTV